MIDRNIIWHLRMHLRCLLIIQTSRQDHLKNEIYISRDRENIFWLARIAPVIQHLLEMQVMHLSLMSVPG